MLIVDGRRVRISHMQIADVWGSEPRLGGEEGTDFKAVAYNMFPPYYKARSDVSVYVFCLDVLGIV